MTVKKKKRTKNKKNNSIFNTYLTTLRNIFFKNIIMITTIMTVVILDKLTKLLIKHLFIHGESINIIGNFFKLTFIENEGIAFGLFSEWSHPLKAIILLVLSVIALIFIGNIYYKSEKTVCLQISFGMIFGGAFGNIYDRLIYKKVVDFLNLGIGHLRWPFFNIADLSITVGVIIIIYLVFIKKQKI